MGVAGTVNQETGMPPLALIRREAAQEAERALRRLIPTDIKPLSPGALEIYRSVHPLCGWRFQVAFNDALRALALILPQDFPFAVPRVALASALPTGFIWPHVENSGLLCLPETEGAYSRDIGALIADALSDACKLIQSNANGDFDPEDFREEFHAYWARAGTTGSRQFKTLIDFRSPSREIRVWWGKSFSLFGETEDAVLGWLKNRYGEPSEPLKTESAIFLWLPHPLLPNEYPSTNGDVFRLAQQIGPPAAGILRRMASALPNKLGVLFGSKAGNDALAGGVVLQCPDDVKRTQKDPKKTTFPGFRPGKMPPHIKQGLYLAAGKRVQRSKVYRVDSAWVHGRDQDADHDRLQLSRIALVGCGSVGGAVARFLAQAGVGHLHLIDPDNLSHTNTSRHVLGADHVGMNKAVALADQLRKEFPHIREVVGKPKAWQKVELEEADVLRACDLVISTVGSWRTESAINETHVCDRQHPPILYGWLEEHGIAGHALLVTGLGGCFHCGFDSTGHPAQKVTSWPGGPPVYREPGCSAIYQPYGSADVAPVLALITRTAIDFLLGRVRQSVCRTWIGDRFALESSGGRWDEKWCRENGDPGPGWCRVEQAWGNRSTCPACSGVSFR